MSRRARQIRRRRSQRGPARAIFVVVGLIAGTVLLAGAAGVGYIVSARQLGAESLEAEAGQPGSDLGRLRRRRDPPGLHPGGHAAHADPVLVHAGQRAQRDGRDRGPPLLQARRRRLRGRRARGDQERLQRQDRPGWLDADDAADPQPLPGRPLAHAEAQDPRGEARLRPRGQASGPARQGVDPHPVPEQRPLRHGRRAERRRDPGGGARLLRQGRERPEAPARRRCSPGCRRRPRSTTRSSIPRRRSSGATRC